jgi:hypothetical protein
MLLREKDVRQPDFFYSNGYFDIMTSLSYTACRYVSITTGSEVQGSAFPDVGTVDSATAMLGEGRIIYALRIYG